MDGEGEDDVKDLVPGSEEEQLAIGQGLIWLYLRDENLQCDM